MPARCPGSPRAAPTGEAPGRGPAPPRARRELRGDRRGPLGDSGASSSSERSRIAEHEGVSVRVLEDGRGPPGLLPRGLSELHSPFHQLPMGLLDVIDQEGDALERPDPVLVTGGREEGDASLCSGDLELDPPLPVTHRLIGEHLEPESPRPELQRPLLVPNRDSDELDPLQHETPHHSAARLRRTGSATTRLSAPAGDGNGAPPRRESWRL